MKRTAIFALALGLGLAFGAAWLLGGGMTTRAAPAAGIQVCATGCAFSTIQEAVDAADPGEVIKVASDIYSDLHARDGVTQVVYISKTVTVRGGYSADFSAWDPDIYYTTLDARGKGRAIYISGFGIKPVVEGFYIENGDAAGLNGPWGNPAGGGVYINVATPTISRCVVYDSSAYRGGGLYSNSFVTLTRNVFTDNKADSGGGLYLHAASFSMDGNVVISNTANWDGGGMMLNGGDRLLTNNVIADNRCGNRGSGVFVYGALPHFAHTTFARNSGGDGAGITVGDPGFSPSYVVMLNTIVSDQNVGVRVTGSSTVTLYATLWHATPTARVGNIFHDANYLGDPAFAADGYHLTAGSAAIDKGIKVVGVPGDLDGDTRPMGNGYDLGADEAFGRVYLPLVLRQDL